MSTLDDGYEVGADEESPRSMRAQLRQQARENGRLRAALAARGAADPPPEPGDGQSDDDRSEVAERIAAAQAAAAKAEAAAEALSRQPVGIPPEVIRAAQLTDIAQSGAIAPSSGLDGMLTRLQDRSVPFPQLLEEMRAMGFRDAPGGWE
jgi:hypothetical protein